MDSNFTGQNRENAVKDGGLQAILRPQPVSYTHLYFPPTEPEQERLPTFYAGPGSHAF